MRGQEPCSPTVPTTYGFSKRFTCATATLRRTFATLLPHRSQLWPGKPPLSSIACCAGTCLRGILNLSPTMGRSANHRSTHDAMSYKRESAARRLLIITYHFPPDGSVGGQRWAGLSKYLARLGWEVHIVTAAVAGDYTSPANVHRHVRNRRRTLNDLYRTHKSRAHGAQSSGQSSPSEAQLGASSFRPFMGVRRIAGGLLGLPDRGRGWVVRAARAARDLARLADFDVVITSGPPHSAHLAGVLAVIGTGSQRWIDMRDPWSTRHAVHLPQDGFIRAERVLLRQLEKLAFRGVTRVIANTREFAAVLKEESPDLDVVFFPNGIDLEQLPEREDASVERASIAHVGTLYLNRSPTPIIAAMGAILRDRGPTTLKLNLAGPMEPANRERVNGEISALGLASSVKMHGVLPREEALNLLTRSHLALVLAQDQPLCVPAKMYESVGLGVPTLVIAEEKSAAAREARRIGAMTVDSGDATGLRSLLEDLLDGRIPTTLRSKTPISYAELATHMDRLLRGGTTRVPD